MPKKYVTTEDFQNWKDNDFKHLVKEVTNLRWFIIGGTVVIGIVLGILQVFG